MFQRSSCYLLILIGISMLSVSLYLLHLTKEHIAGNQTKKAKLLQLVFDNEARFRDAMIEDLISRSVTEILDDTKNVLSGEYKRSLTKQTKKRFTEILPYLIYRKLKWQIVRDIKKSLVTDVSKFIKNNPEVISKIKKKLEEGKTAAASSENKHTKHVAKPLPVEQDIIPSDVNNLCTPNKKMKHHNRVLSYCVYGGRQLYYDGIELVIKDARKLGLYKDWQVRIYHDEAVSMEKIKQYEKNDNIFFCDVRKLPRYGNLTNLLGKFWRVVPMADPSVDLFCPRDLDSNILTREEDAVKEFIDSGMILHTMRDHRQHEVGMMAGMWCFHNRINRTMGRMYLERLLEKAKTYKLRTDQPLLNKVIWDHISKYHLYDLVLQHDSYNCKFYKGSKPFPTKRKKDNEFIGCPVHDCDQKLKPCPEVCRPSYGKTWKYC